MVRPWIAICLWPVFLTMIGCGGGGGSGDPAGNAPPTPASPQPADPEPEPPPPADPPQNGASTASVVFPWGRSGATAGTVTVRGTASDPDGVSRVLINDVPASIARAVTAPLSASTAKASATGEDEDVEEVSFAVTVPLEPGENEVSVDVEDARGQISKRVYSVTVDYVEVPIPFDMDEARLRLAGLGFSPVDSDAILKLVVHNYDTGEQTVYPQPFSGIAGYCLKGDTDAFLYLQRTDDGYDLRSFDLAGRHDSIVVSIPPTLLDPGSDYLSAPFSGSLECGSADPNAYALFNFARENEPPSRSRILRIHIDSKAIDVLAETDPAESPPWFATHTALTDAGLITLTDANSDAPLTSVDLATGARTVLTPFDVEGQAIAPALQEDKIYIAGFGGVEEIDLAGGPSVRRVSPEQGTDPLVFSQVRSAGYDAGRDRVIVADSDLDMLVSVEVSTGHRSRLLARALGSGVRMIAPRRIAVTSDGTKAYVADDGGNASEKLFEVDLATGNRRVVGDIDHADNVGVSGLAVDEQSRLAYVAVHDSVLQVHLDTGAVTVLAGPAVSGSLLGSVSDLLLDNDDQRLLVADDLLEAVVALDLVTGEQSVFSLAGTAGAGPAFANINSLTRSPSTGHLYATNQLTENVMRIDPTTGDRAVVLNECLDDASDDVLGNEETLQQVLAVDASGELLILGDNLLWFDPETAACTVLQPFANPSLLWLQLMPDGRVLGAAFGALVQYDIQSGEAVIISK